MKIAMLTHTALRHQPWPPGADNSAVCTVVMLLLLMLLLLPLPGIAGTAVSAAIRQCLHHDTSRGAQAPHQITADDLRAFYSARHYQPLWTQAHRLGELRHAIAELAADGLQPGHYSIPTVAADAGASPGQEIGITRAWLQALFHLHFGVLNRDDIEPLWRHHDTDLREQRSDLLRVALASADNPAAAFAAARVKLRTYRILREAYRGLAAKDATAPPWPVLPTGPILRPGMQDSRVLALRRRLHAGGYPLPLTNTPGQYDEALLATVMAFQHQHSLAEDGLVGPLTTRALNTSREQRLQQLRANLERWRWLARELAPDMVIVNISGATIRYYREGELRWRARTIVGTAGRKTPSLRSAITHFTFNPSWTVPPTILRQDKLPAIRSDPRYLETQQLHVFDRQGRPLDPSQVDWRQPGPIILRQEPGPDNALGVVAIRFPNPFAVYLHDTPQKHLFQRSQRTHSSGCVRVDDVLTLVAALLESAGGCGRDVMTELINAGNTHRVDLDNPVPLLMDYWTATVDAAGQLLLHSDHYRRDAALARALEQQSPAPKRLFCSISG